MGERLRALAVVLLLLAACDQNADDERPVVEATPTQLTFEGGDYKTDAERIAHGERLTRVLGCRGCHTASLQGQRFYELYASNLTRDVPKYSDEQLERLIRSGIHPSGRDVWGMPSEIFQHLGDRDYKSIVAYLRTLDRGGEPTGKPLPFEPNVQKLIAEGKIKPAAAFVRETKTVGPIDLGPEHALGRYITRVTCAECHGSELSGNEGDTPDLIVAGGYSRGEFERLITQGIPTGNRKLKNELMALVAQSRFSHLTPHERDALYAYLKARAERPQ
jgi:mono/diheme cytochrome c family protein